MPQKTERVTGKFQYNPRGFGFVQPEDGSEDVFIPPEGIGGAAPGDRVTLDLRKGRRPGSTEGHVREVLERGIEKLVGQVRIGNRGVARLVPLSRDLPYPVELRTPLPKSYDPKKDPLVAVRIDWGESTSDRLIGVLETVLGPISDPATDTLRVIHQNDLPLTFPEEVTIEAKRIPPTITEQEILSRRDLRDLPFVTIDGADARDHDDAIALEGPNVAWVAIADVSHYVFPDTELDREAAIRGNSYYFPDRVLPMLPEFLSNNLCSLRPREDRLALAIRMEFSSEGDLQQSEICEAILRSSARLTYEGVDKAFKEGPSGEIDTELLKTLSAMRSLTANLYRRRISQGGIDFDLSESRVVLDLHGAVTAMTRRERTPSQGIVEELMLAANRGVALKIGPTPYPLVYRVHDRPNEKKLWDFLKLLRTYGYTIPKVSPDDSGKILNDLLKRFEGDARGRVFSYLALRSMKQAYYTPTNIGHFGLGFSDYVHFTSPIRRYADLLVHRSIRNWLSEADPKKSTIFPKNLGTLENTTTQISLTERAAQRAEREIRTLKGVRFFQDKIGKSFAGVIVGFVSKGFFVELEEHAVEGFVHVDRLQGDHFDFLEDQMVMKGRRRGKTFRLGDRMNVRVEEASLESARLEFSPAAGRP